MPSGLPAWKPHDTFALVTMRSMLASSLTMPSGAFSPRSEFRSMVAMDQTPIPRKAKMGPTETIPMYQVSRVTSVPAISNTNGYLRVPSRSRRNQPMYMNTVRPIGRMSPLKPPTNTRIAAGAVPIERYTMSETTMKPTVAHCSDQPPRKRLWKLERNDAEVYAAPITELSAAAQKIAPKMRSPASPSTAPNAWPAGLAAWPERSRVTPDATTPRIARNSTYRMIPVTNTPFAAARMTGPAYAGPV